MNEQRKKQQIGRENNATIALVTKGIRETTKGD